MYGYGYTPDDHDFALADKKEKDRVIDAARKSLHGMEDMIETAINVDPPRFVPSVARELREQFARLGAALDEAIVMLAQERNEFSDMAHRLKTATRKLKERDEQVEKLISDAGTRQAQLSAAETRLQQYAAQEAARDCE